MSVLSGTVLGPSGALNNASVTAYAASLFDGPPAVGEVPPDGEQGVTMFGPVQSGSQFGGNGQYVIDNVVGGVAYYIASFLPTYNTTPTYYWKYDGSLLSQGTFAGNPNGTVPASSIGQLVTDISTPALWQAVAADDSHWIQIGGILPTSAAGLVTGSLWNNGGAVHVA